MISNSLIVTCIAIVALGNIPISTAQKQCVEQGEYCQNHWDCCSNSCMSFTYRCVGNLQPQRQTVLINRGGFETNGVIIPGGGNTNVVRPGNRQCAQNGGYCQNHWDCCSNSCLSFSYICIESNQAPQSGQAVFVNRGSFYPIASESSGPKMTVEDLVNNVFSQQSVPFGATNTQNSVNVRPADAQPTCLDIGAKCYRNSECCTQRCHGYLHQCVT